MEKSPKRNLFTNQLIPLEYTYNGVKYGGGYTLTSWMSYVFNSRRLPWWNFGRLLGFRSFWCWMIYKIRGSADTTAWKKHIGFRGLRSCDEGWFDG